MQFTKQELENIIILLKNGIKSMNLGGVELQEAGRLMVIFEREFNKPEVKEPKKKASDKEATA